MNPHFNATHIALACSLASLAAQAEIVYSQTSTDPSQTDFGWYSSSEPRPTRNFKHADNFMLGSSTQVTAINWWGTSEGLSHTDLTNFDSFQIEFWSSRTQPNGRIKPDALLSTESFDLDETNATDTGRRSTRGAIQYMHSATLGSAVTLEADTMYWISISARSIHPTADVWQWQDADTFDQISSSWTYQFGVWQYQFDTDSAFELVTVPSPSALSIVCCVSLGLTTRRRRSGTRLGSSL